MFIPNSKRVPIQWDVSHLASEFSDLTHSLGSSMFLLPMPVSHYKELAKEFKNEGIHFLRVDLICRISWNHLLMLSLCEGIFWVVCFVLVVVGS